MTYLRIKCYLEQLIKYPFFFFVSLFIYLLTDYNAVFSVDMIDAISYLDKLHMHSITQLVFNTGVDNSRGSYFRP